MLYKQKADLHRRFTRHRSDGRDMKHKSKIHSTDHCVESRRGRTRRKCCRKVLRACWKKCRHQSRRKDRAWISSSVTGCFCTEQENQHPLVLTPLKTKLFLAKVGRPLYFGRSTCWHDYHKRLARLRSNINTTKHHRQYSLVRHKIHDCNLDYFHASANTGVKERREVWVCPPPPPSPLSNLKNIKNV